MYRLANGDFAQIGYMENNFTITDLYHWLGITNYVRTRDAEESGQ